MDSAQELDDRFLRRAGLDEPAISNLIDLRQRVVTGECSELTLAHKYLLFLKYLVETERVDREGLN